MANETNIKKIQIEDLLVDPENPRISEFGITSNTKQEEIIQILWDSMAVNELVYSIISNGYWGDLEPLIAIKEGNKYIVIEGNRRLAAVKLIHNRKGLDVKFDSEIEGKITKKLLEQTQTLPVNIVDDKEKSWRFIGFKHVNGPAKWGSYAKAKYIADIHKNYKISLKDIADQIGDTNKTIEKLFQGLMVLEQAERTNVYKRENINAPRLYFSHLYTGLQREGIKEFLELKNPEEQSIDPVPEGNLKKLGELLQWMYGSVKDDIQSVIKTQNPDLKYLDEVLKDKEALSALRDGETLVFAYELSRPDDSLFEEFLFSAKKNLQKAKTYITTGYDGERDMLNTAGETADIADGIFEEMEGIYNSKHGNKSKKRRIID